MPSFLTKFTRKKIIDRDETSTELHRVLSTWDLTMLGIGSTLGIGVYVLAGSVAKESAGPAVVISFLVAAIASVLAGLCYAEFGSRVPKAGSAYVYSYVCVGELIAFIVGWNLIMEYVIGVASVAKGYSGYVDQLFDHALSNAFTAYLPVNVSFLSNYFDVFAFAITLLLTVLLAFGVKESSLFNNIFTVLNLGVVIFVIVAGSFFATTENWTLSKESILNSTNITSDKIGEGGFAPFGIHGIMKGAATCFYGFVGFDCIATTGEEAKNPQRAIPIAIIFSLLFIFLAYFGISSVITMMVPYYLQDPEAPLPQAFMSVGFGVGKWIVTIGALFGLSTSLLGAMFPMPRVIYAMASDGVLFKFLAKIHPRFQTPVIATLLAGTFGGFMAALFKLEALVDMMSIGTLTAYTLVAVCVLCLRYRKDVDGADDHIPSPTMSLPVSTSKIGSYLCQTINRNGLKIPTDFSSSCTDVTVFLYCICTVFFCATAIFGEEEMLSGNKYMQALLGILAALLCFFMISLSLQPVSRVKLSFRVPLVPLVPGLSILFNTYLIMKLSGMTWIRFIIWMAVGFFFYGICLLSGTTDNSYQASLENRKARKYSRVSASGFGNKGINDDDTDAPSSSDDTDLSKQLSKNNNKEKETLRTTIYPSITSLSNGNFKSAVQTSSQPDENIQIIHANALSSSLDAGDFLSKTEESNKRESIRNETPAEVAAKTVASVISEAFVHPSVIHIRGTQDEGKPSENIPGESLGTHSLEAAMTFSDGSSDEPESIEGMSINSKITQSTQLEEASLKKEN